MVMNFLILFFPHSGNCLIKIKLTVKQNFALLVLLLVFFSFSCFGQFSKVLLSWLVSVGLRDISCYSVRCC